MGALDLSVVGPSIPAIEKSMLIHVRKLSDIYDRKFLYVVLEPIFVLGSGSVSVPRDIPRLCIDSAIQDSKSGSITVAAATIKNVNCLINCFISNKKAPTNLIVSA